MPGFVYLALGDPMQKRNYYRAGWIRFRDDTEMSNVMVELSEKKVGFIAHSDFPDRLIQSIRSRVSSYTLHITFERLFHGCAIPQRLLVNQTGW
jgi:hypothetical protein